MIHPDANLADIVFKGGEEWRNLNETLREEFI